LPPGGFRSGRPRRLVWSRLQYAEKLHLSLVYKQGKLTHYPAENRVPEGHCRPAKCVLAWGANLSKMSDDVQGSVTPVLH
jgi:hypothetical protein